jgi:hypothetical protein
MNSGNESVLKGLRAPILDTFVKAKDGSVQSSASEHQHRFMIIKDIEVNIQMSPIGAFTNIFKKHFGKFWAYLLVCFLNYLIIFKYKIQKNNFYRFGILNAWEIIFTSQKNWE